MNEHDLPVHYLPVVDSTDRMHVLGRTCWCKPEVRQLLRGADQIVHKAMSDDDERTP